MIIVSNYIFYQNDHKKYYITYKLASNRNILFACYPIPFPIEFTETSKWQILNIPFISLFEISSVFTDCKHSDYTLGRIHYAILSGLLFTSEMFDRLIILSQCHFVPSMSLQRFALGAVLCVHLLSFSPCVHLLSVSPFHPSDVHWA